MGDEAGKKSETELTSGMIMGASEQFAGGLLKSYGMYAEGQALAATAKYNRALMAAQGRTTDAAYNFDIRRQIKAGEEFLSTQRNAIARSGIRLDGSAIELMINSAKEIELDVFRLEFDRDVQAANREAADRQMEIQAKYGKRQATISSVGSLVQSTISTVGGLYGGGAK